DRRASLCSPDIDQATGAKPMQMHVLQPWTGRRVALFVGAALLGLAVACSSSEALAAFNVLEPSYNKFRTGATTVETVLTAAKVAASAIQFQKRFRLQVDGEIEGSPLYASGVTIAGGTHNVLYVATMHNTVHAFDADTGAQLSARWLGNPVTGN